MQARLNYSQFAPKLTQKLAELGSLVPETLFSQNLVHLVEVRASQINGCSFCVDMHIKQLKILGERDLRIHHVSAWRESTLFTQKERAALEWTEALTKITDRGISDKIYNQTREVLSEEEIVNLTFVVGLINTWNRLNAAFRTVPGSLDKLYGLDKAGL